MVLPCNLKTVRYSVGSINYEHIWYIAKMEGIVSVIVTAVVLRLSDMTFIILHSAGCDTRGGVGLHNQC